MRRGEGRDGSKGEGGEGKRREGSRGKSRGEGKGRVSGFSSQPTWQPYYLHNLISVQSSGRTRSSSVVTLARPSVSSSLQITNRSFTYASPYLWNQLPSSFRQPQSVHAPHGSPHLAHITSSQSLSSLSPSITPAAFHVKVETHLFHKSFSP